MQLKELTNIYYSNEGFDKIEKGSIITTGSFDGLHKGHIKLFEKMNRMAKAANTRTLVITFEPHPRTILNDVKENFLLTTLEEKLNLIKQSELIDDVLIIKFDRNFSELSPKEFLQSMVLQTLKPYMFVVGYDTHFGKDRMGDITFLKNTASANRVKIELVEPEIRDGLPISSSLIRKHLRFGEIRTANEMLGYKYFLNGIVIKGEGRGAVLGFPTANLKYSENIKILPQDGVYAVGVYYREELYKGMMNIGKHPTFNENFTLEVHILDFNENLYGKELKTYFIKRVRDEVKFQTTEELITQLKIDKEEINNLKEALWH